MELRLPTKTWVYGVVKAIGEIQNQNFSNVVIESNNQRFLCIANNNKIIDEISIGCVGEFFIENHVALETYYLNELGEKVAHRKTLDVISYCLIESFPKRLPGKNIGSPPVPF